MFTTKIYGRFNFYSQQLYPATAPVQARFRQAKFKMKQMGTLGPATLTPLLLTRIIIGAISKSLLVVASAFQIQMVSIHSWMTTIKMRVLFDIQSFEMENSNTYRIFPASISDFPFTQLPAGLFQFQFFFQWSKLRWPELFTI